MDERFVEYIALEKEDEKNLPIVKSQYYAFTGFGLLAMFISYEWLTNNSPLTKVELISSLLKYGTVVGIILLIVAFMIGAFNSNQRKVERIGHLRFLESHFILPDSQLVEYSSIRDCWFSIQGYSGEWRFYNSILLDEPVLHSGTRNHFVYKNEFGEHRVRILLESKKRVDHVYERLQPFVKRKVREARNKREFGC